MADDGFDREMADAHWAEVYQRQIERGALIDDITRILGIDAADTVLEVGSGPGYTALRLADHASKVIAIDRHPAALRYCRQQATQLGVHNVDGVTTDAEALGVQFEGSVIVLLAFVLHHAESPPTVIAEIQSAISTGSPLLAVEYHPTAPGEVGPPTDHRIDPDTISTWLHDAGFAVESQHTLPEEKYAIRARRL